MNKKLNFTISLIIAFLLVLGMTGPVFAQTPTPPAGETPTTQTPGLWQSIAQALQMGVNDLQAALKSGKTITQLASEKGVDLKALMSTLTSKISQRLQQAVSGGKMTQDQADQKLNTLQSGLNTWFTTGAMPADLKQLNILRQAHKVLADALGMSVQDLNAALKSGKTIAQLAQNKGVSLDTLVNDVTAKRSQELQKAVQDGKMTQVQADKELNALKTGATQWFQTGKVPESWKIAQTLQNDRIMIAKDLGMSVQDLNAALKSGKTISQLAQDKSVSLDTLVSDVTAQRAQQLQKAVLDGKMTQDQANKALSTLKDNITQWFNTGKRPNALKIKQEINDMTGNLASQLGMTTDELKQALKGGKTLTQLAQEKGVSLDSLVNTLSAQRTEQIQQALKNGKITQDQANKALENLKKNLTNRLENGKRFNPTPPQTTPQPNPTSGA
jgi:lambda repressor-like predicted transcriptional regulator